MHKTVDEQQIEAWKKKHRNVFLVEVEGKQAYIKSPGRKELSYATSVSGKDPLKFNEAILETCWLAGDDEIKTDDKLFFGVSGKLDEIIEASEASIKKL